MSSSILHQYSKTSFTRYPGLEIWCILKTDFWHFQATSGENGTVENGGTNFSVNPRETSDVPDTHLTDMDNPDPKTTNVTTKHVKQNSFDSGIADAAHSFSSARGSHKTVTSVLSD